MRPDASGVPGEGDVAELDTHGRAGVDLQAPGYLPKVFGPGHYALLSAPERLPLVLLDWTRRLLAR